VSISISDSSSVKNTYRQQERNGGCWSSHPVALSTSLRISTSPCCRDAWVHPGSAWSAWLSEDITSLHDLHSGKSCESSNVSQNQNTKMCINSEHEVCIRSSVHQSKKMHKTCKKCGWSVQSSGYLGHRAMASTYCNSWPPNSAEHQRVLNHLGSA
jgi:hypothetical protein